ncbi:hypothetical protein GNZ12_00885 [Paraburkholderia sp. 1N]|uniref:Uncharacterized protein n=1 Tax=Paraburkholderia solitsugae TaxID=2675748 RepID=A0ABX2BJF0_9BURK|nr:hypothetical protein [Paraburkholderia solitsugae]NPT39900.1 hypothetical protein [Paraburkholderia solitsugae]
MSENFALAYWIGLFAILAVFSFAGMFGIGALVRGALRVRTYHAGMYGAVAGALLGFALLGTLPIFG